MRRNRLKDVESEYRDVSRAVTRSCNEESRVCQWRLECVEVELQFMEVEECVELED